MIDPILAGTQAVAQRTVLAPLLVFAAGTFSSFGPCVAPRFIALAACTAQARRPRSVLLAFVAGLVSAYAAFGLGSSLLAGARASASAIYAAVALGLFAGGLWTLVRAGHPHAPRGAERDGERSLGAIVVLGASFAFVISPCCTPLVAVILAYTSMVGSAWYGAGLLALFALGHALPLVLYGALGARAAGVLRRAALGQAVAVTNGALMLALAAYYGLLA
jgi:cytochrome c-type biogenesis protein